MATAPMAAAAMGSEAAEAALEVVVWAAVAAAVAVAVSRRMSTSAPWRGSVSVRPCKESEVES